MTNKINMRVVFRNVFQAVEIPSNLTLIQDKGHEGVIFTMNKPKVLRGRELIVQGTKDEIHKAMNFWQNTYGDELYTEVV